LVKQNKSYHPYQESHWRSITKALTWRLIATSTTFFITYIVLLHNAKAEIPKELLDHAAREAFRKAAKQDAVNKAFFFAGSVAILDLIIKLILYYFHERIWQSVNAGWIRKYNRSRRIKAIRKKRLAAEMKEKLTEAFSLKKD